MNKTILVKRISENPYLTFKKKCKGKNITMTNAIRIFIYSIAAGSLLITEQKTIKQSQIEIDSE